MSSYEILMSARKNGYAIGAFNCVNLETITAIVEAAELEKTAVILQISENAARYAGLEELFAIAKIKKERANVPIIIHFDHAETYESAKKALDLGFDSVMLESAKLKPEENIRQLKELSNYAKTKHALVEGEFEITTKGSRSGQKLSAVKIAEMVQESGCELVAIDIGSKHKMTTKEASLDLKHLKEIANLVDKPLVLHGASGVSKEELQKAIKLGITKVNVATELMLSFSNAIRTELKDPDLYDARKYLARAQSKMQAKVREIIQLLQTH